jgi:hypothetical protein
MRLSFQPYPFTKAGSTERLVERVTPRASERASKTDYEALRDPSISPGLRNRIAGAVMTPDSEYARSVRAEVADLVDEGCLEASVAASLLRLLPVKDPEPVAWSDEMGDDGGAKGRLGFSMTKRAPEGALRLRVTGASDYTPAELRRICQLIEASPHGPADMSRIYAQVDRERRLGRFAA